MSLAVQRISLTSQSLTGKKSLNGSHGPIAALDQSTSHASSVLLVLNPNTGSITPQFHVVFDDWFATVTSKIDNLPNSYEWRKLFGNSTYQYMFDDDDVNALDQLSSDLENQIDTENAEFARNCVLEAADQLCPSQPLDCQVFQLHLGHL